MKILLVGILSILSAQSFASSQCHELADLELANAKLVSSYRMTNYRSLSKAQNKILKTITEDLLNSADDNYTSAVFDMTCSTDENAVAETLSYMNTVNQTKEVYKIIKSANDIKKLIEN